MKNKKTSQNHPNQQSISKNNFIDLTNYELISPIGKGTFSTVWKAKDKRTNKIYAAKILKFFVDEETSDSAYTLSTFREVNLMALLNHPSVLKLIGYFPVNFENDPNPTIIIDFACNGSLRDIIDKEQAVLSLNEWTFTKKQTTTYGIASGLQYLHAHKIIYRDLKPDNIFMNEDLNPKIGDFGLSKIIDNMSASMNMMSLNYGTKGTPIYMAPEILTDENYSEKSDVYAFAFIAYEIFCYEKPFSGCSIHDIMNKVVNQGYRPPISDDVPDAYKNLIENCWAQNPDERPSFNDIIEEMKTNQQFITDLTDEVAFCNYVDFIENSQCSFDFKNQLMHFDEFIRAYGRNNTITGAKINE